MIYHSKAALRIGLAGGGTDVSPYCDLYGGIVINTTISLYAHVSIEIIPEDLIILQAKDINEKQVFPLTETLAIDGRLDLHKAVYNRIRKDYHHPVKGFRLTSFVDVPPGSGLGTSSTLVVAIIGAFKEMLQLPLTNDQVAKYAYDIERNDLKFSGGRQDQYAACHGGFNFMEFHTNGQASIQSLKIPEKCLQTIQNNLLLYFTNTSRNSADIINEQVKNVEAHLQESIDAMHHLKEQAVLMRAVLQNGNTDELGPLLHTGFRYKKAMASNISNPFIEAVYAAALKAGATGGKISGAGGGGFMVFYCPADTKKAVTDALAAFGGQVKDYTFVQQGFHCWCD